MESRIRVQDIKKKFENLNTGIKDQSNVTKTNANRLNNIQIAPVGNCKSNLNQWDSQNKPHVKRTPAFRSAKNSLPNLKQTPNPPKVEQNTNGSTNESQLFTALTDTLKKKLQAPLPKGPAPQKPPRTFAHAAVNGQSPTEQQQQRRRFSAEEQPPSLTRSRTEPHIMLKKIESALLFHQNKMARKENVAVPKPSPRFNVTDNRNYGNFHVYDTPCISSDPPPQPPTPISPSSTRKENETKCFRLFKNPCTTDNEPVYTEPYVPKFVNGENVKKSPTKTEVNYGSTTSQSSSLHYLSSPIMLDHQDLNGVKYFNSYEEAFKKIQMKMIEPFNNNLKSETDSDGDSVKDLKHQIVEERKIYAKRVASIKKTPHQKSTSTGTSSLIDALLLIGIDHDMDGHVAYIKSKFPSDHEIPDNFARLVFPDTESWPLPSAPDHLPKSSRHNNYTIFITAADGSRSYAYCRRIQPEGSAVCLPLVYTILTTHRPNTLYYKILKFIENKHGLPKTEFNTFINLLQQAKYPLRKESVRIGDLQLYRSNDERQDSMDISSLLQIVGVPVFIQVLSSVLHERKVIFVGSYISVLSDSIEGILKSLYPFEWQHTIISLLPTSMSELLQAPTPYIVGLLKNRKDSIPNHFFSDIDDVIVVDVDTGTIIKKMGDEGSVIPDRLSKALREALYITPVHSTDVAPSEALIRLFVELVGHYNNHLISTVPEKNRTFHKDNFIKAPSIRSVRLFLEWFTETALFHSFIQERVERTNEIGLFEQRCAEYVEQIVMKEKNNTKSRGLKSLKEWATSSS